MIRRLEYEEIAKTNTIRAVGYLQTRLSEIIDHSNSDQLQEFHKLASLLFKGDDVESDSQTNSANSSRSDSTTAMDIELSGKSTTTTVPDPSTSDSNDSTKSESKEWSLLKSERYQYYTPPPPTIYCYGANTLKKDAELFTNKSEEQQFAVKNQRCLLYNKLIELMPEHMVQPRGNLSDFVII